MELFQEMKEKFYAFYKKCEVQMPEQAIVLPEVPKKLPSRAATPEVDHEDDTRDKQELEDMIQGDGTSEEMTLEMTSPRPISRQKTIQEGYTPKGSISHHVVIHNSTTSKSIPHKKPYIQKTLILRVHEQPTQRNIIITKDPRKSIPLRDPSALKRAMELIANVLRANGMQPDWDPEGTSPRRG